MGDNKWNTSDTWPPKGAQPIGSFYLSDGGGANTRHGDGALTAKPGAVDKPDSFTYDPMDAQDSRTRRLSSRKRSRRNLVRFFDQRKIEERADVLVYTTEPFVEGTAGERPDLAYALRFVGMRKTPTSPSK